MNKEINEMIKGKNTIGVGLKRIVYDLDNGYVLKVAKSKNGIDCNKKEVMIYRSFPPTIKKYLGRIRKHSNEYSWIIMKKYGMDFHNTKINKRKLSDMIRKFRRYGIIPNDISGRRASHNNLRLDFNGKIVVIDYGNFKYRR
jgi:hypothetical protein